MIQRIAIPIIILLVSLMDAGSLQAHSRRNNIGEIIAKTKALYNTTHTAEIHFEQQGTTGSTSGVLRYGQDRKFRLELPQQTIVSNGEKTWSYNPRRNQVVVSNSASGGGRLTPTDILTSFPGNYACKLIGEQKINGQNVWVVECVPGTGNRIADVTKATLYIDKATHRFQQIDVVSESVGSMKLRITSARYGLKLADSNFNFTPPRDATVVDMTR